MTWHIEVWTKKPLRWLEVGTDDNEAFVEDGVKALALAHGVARAWREADEGWTGMRANIHTGFVKWTGSGGLVRCK